MSGLVTTDSFDPRLQAVAALLRLFEKASVTRDDMTAAMDFSARPMTPAERAGYLHALDVMRTWAAQLEVAAEKLSDDPADAVARTPRQLCIERTRLVGDLAFMQQLATSPN